MRSPAAVNLCLALPAFLLVASAAANGNGYGGGHETNLMPAYQRPVDGLDSGYYSKSCWEMEAIVQRAVRKAVGADRTLAASLIRLFFHDFAVRGTDASVLVDSPGSEKHADASKTLRGFELIEAIKTELEAKCKNTVSCADILTAAARDAATTVGVPYWSLRYGRKDGKESREEEADRHVPMGRESVTDLIAFFESNGLNIVDLVALSGAHTIGRATCGAVKPGLCDRRRDGSLDRQYGDFLQRKCSAGGDAEYVELDGETPTAFDNQHYKNLMRGKGLLPTDQKLLRDSRTADFVRSFANQGSQIFVHQFAQSMRHLGEAQVLTGDEGEVRRKCSAVN
ncbi:peroxidase 7-like [Phragmites australis]|uniref:peroxidase 7-like n=1 Tax=Phragmites australis TaxID=29695 RepID=UPI002D776EBF|nr:peroxidase 7-like [Phragmites australis]